MSKAAVVSGRLPGGPIGRTIGPRLGLVAGEASGDLLGGLLLAALKRRWPSLVTQGVGGPQMKAQGMDAWWPHHLLSVMGYAEALGRIVSLLRLRRRLGDRLIAERPDAFIGIDAPDFNFGLERRLKEHGIKSIHFVSPSIWAWRGERIRKIARSVDHVLCLFPFEPAIYESAGIPATYVGHPLADAIPLEVPRDASRRSLGLAADDVVVALLPGSRRSEIQHVGPAMFAAAARLQVARSAIRFVLPSAPGLVEAVRHCIRDYGFGIDVQVIEGRSHEALAACDVAIVASGTATLEAALFKRPMVITYRLGWLNWQLMKDRGYLPWVGLPNILLREFAVPEFIQDAATPEALAAAALRWLDDPEACRALASRFDELHRQLRCNTALKATDAIAKIIGS